ncbi:TetR/AcrR family transcriptional regulator [Pediococcus acidilactici]|uniref:TetR/AcrR family transcriptional regulator n=1 Tax=Pediococcus acidilactici TaxID=1254 RepID=UPI003B428DA4
MNNPDLRIQKSKRDIEQAFIQLVNQKGFTHTNVKDICDTALVGRSTFYRYYDDKYMLLEELVKYYTAIFNDLITNRTRKKFTTTSLFELYQELEDYKVSMLCLLNISIDDISLQKNFRKILIESLTQYLSTKKLTVSKQFIQELYVSSVITTLKWSLTNGTDPQIATLMNTTLKYIVDEYTLKAEE